MNSEQNDTSPTAHRSPGTNIIEVAPPHPIYTLMEEHKIILAKLAELSELVNRIRLGDSYSGVDKEITALRDVAHHLIEAESHHKREEDALFPILEARGITGPTKVMREEHVELRKRKHELRDILGRTDSVDFAEFKNLLKEPCRYLTLMLANHISKEDNVLYQMALQVLTEDKWNEIKIKCDAIGYCCFTPDDVH